MSNFRSSFTAEAQRPHREHGENSAAADKLHDFQLVAFAQMQLGPFRAPRDSAVVLDGYAVLRQSQNMDQFLQRNARRNGTALTIDLYLDVSLDFF